MNIKTHLNLFLESNDSPTGTNRVQDSRQGNNSEDHTEHEGLAVWMGSDTSPIFRLVDIRWVFHTEAQAQAFHQSSLQENSEGAARIPDAPQVGVDCYIFGGDRKDKLTQAIMGANFTIREFYYIFRVANVVAKLYVAEGPMAAAHGQRLNIEMVHTLAERAVKRIHSELENPENSAARDSDKSKPSLWRRLFS